MFLFGKIGCNKEEAFSLKKIAEEKINTNEYAEAKKFASKAKSLYPDIEGIDQQISIIDIHLALKEKDASYKILSVDESANSATLKKRYMKLSLQFHPDKNKSAAGAGSAFNIIKEAYDELLEKAKKREQTTSTVVFEQNTSKVTTSDPAQRSECDTHSFPANSDSKLIPEQQTTGPAKTDTSDPTPLSNARICKQNSAASTPNSKVKGKKQKSGPSNKPPLYRRVVHRTFWTSCNKCNGKFEYPTVYRDHKIECHMCHEPFSATEIPPPTII